MGSKKKRSARRAPQSLLAQIHRNLEKANYKQALKDAKVCYRQAPTEEHRRWLEMASIARAQELQRQNHRDACRGVIESLLELGIREPSVQAALPDVLIWLGMRDRLPAEASDSDRARWDIKLADQAILRPDAAVNLPSSVRAGVGAVRSAFERIYAGDTAPAQALLRDIPRESPLADWKLFARGLIAYYAQDEEQRRANWSRLDPERSAARIAAALTAVSQGNRGSVATHERGAITRLEQRLSEQPVLMALSNLQQRVAAGEWPKALQALRGVVGGLRRLDPALCQRLVRCLVARAIGEGRVDQIDRLARLVEPLPLDPHWNRARAAVRESSDTTRPRQAIPYWHKYRGDLSSVAELAPAERSLAEAMVWVHVAAAHMAEAEEWRHCECGERHDEEVDAEAEQAIACLERAIGLAPGYLPAHEALAVLYLAQKKMEKAAAAYRRALEQVPDWFDALEYLTQHHLHGEEPITALQYAQRARRLKPLDRQTIELAGTAHVAAAREFARNGEYDQGRAQFAAADALLPERCKQYHVLGRKAALEIVAGCAEKAQELLTAAQESLEEPAPLWLLMTIEAARMNLAASEVSLYEMRWTAALKRRCRSATAGQMCAVVHAHLQLQSGYTIPSSLVAELLAYVRRCSRVKWAEQDLHDVCAFLLEIDKEPALLRKYVRKGVKRFPAAAYFHFLAGELEFRRGPYRCRRRSARRSLEKALELSQGSTTAESEHIRTEARRNLTMLDEASSFSGLPFGRFSSLASTEHEDYEDYEDYEHEDYGTEESTDGEAWMDELPSPESLSPAELISIIEAACEKMGLDPEIVLEKLAAERGIRLPDLQPDRSKKKRRRKEKSR